MVGNLSEKKIKMVKLETYTVELKKGVHNFLFWVKSEKTVLIFIMLNFKGIWHNNEKIKFSITKKFRSKETWSCVSCNFDVVFPGEYKIKIISKDNAFLGKAMIKSEDEETFLSQYYTIGIKNMTYDLTKKSVKL